MAKHARPARHSSTIAGANDASLDEVERIVDLNAAIHGDAGPRNRGAILRLSCATKMLKDFRGVLPSQTC
jgi:hypothetical protein